MPPWIKKYNVFSGIAGTILIIIVTLLTTFTTNEKKKQQNFSVDGNIVVSGNSNIIGTGNVSIVPKSKLNMNEANKKEYVKVQNLLEQLNKDKKWPEMFTSLEKIKDRSDLSDLYNYFLGRLSIFNPILNISNPKHFLLKIPFDSKYYLRSRKSLVYYVSNSSLKQEERYKEYKEIADDFLKYNFDIPYYFFLRNLSIDLTSTDSYDKLNMYYKQFKNKYDKCINDNYEIVINIKVKQTAFMNQNPLFLIIPTLFLFHANFAIISENLCIIDKRMYHLDIVNKILESNSIQKFDNFSSKYYGFKNLFEGIEQLINNINDDSKCFHSNM